MNKTADIEEEIAFVLRLGPMTLEAMESKLPEAIRSIDRTWIGIAVYKMLDDDRIRAVSCAHQRHEGSCVVKAAK